MKTVTFCLFTMRHLVLTIWLLSLIPATLWSQSISADAAPDQIVHRARYLMPESLQRLLRQREQFLVEGMSRISLSIEDDKDRNGQHDDELLTRKLEEIVKMLQGQANFSRMVRDFGEVAQLTIRISLPRGDNFRKDDLKYFLNYMGRQGNNFELIIYDTPAQEAGEEVIHKLLSEIRQRRALYSSRLQSGYPRPFTNYPAEELNERSAFYGVAQLVYSHAVIDIARLWLWIWMEANGDLQGSRLLESYRNQGDNSYPPPQN